MDFLLSYSFYLTNERVEKIPNYVMRALGVEVKVFVYFVLSLLSAKSLINFLNTENGHLHTHICKGRPGRPYLTLPDILTKLICFNHGNIQEPAGYQYIINKYSG